MKVPMLPNILAALVCSCLACGCSQDNATASRAPSTPADGAGPLSAATTRVDDPCSLLTDAEVRTVFSGALAGKRNHSLDGNGILTCLWATPTDSFVVQVFAAKSGSVEEELRSRISGSVDPVMPGAGDRIRYEKMAGDQAMLVIEQADPRRGILADTAVLVTQRGDRRAVLFTGQALARTDRASALASLEALGRSVSNRL